MAGIALQSQGHVCAFSSYLYVNIICVSILKVLRVNFSMWLIYFPLQLPQSYSLSKH